MVNPKLTSLCVFFLFLPFKIEKIMSSIGEGIDFSQEQQKISGTVPSGHAACNHNPGSLVLRLL